MPLLSIHKGEGGATVVVAVDVTEVDAKEADARVVEEVAEGEGGAVVVEDVVAGAVEEVEGTIVNPKKPTRYSMSVRRNYFTLPM